MTAPAPPAPRTHPLRQTTPPGRAVPLVPEMPARHRTGHHAPDELEQLEHRLAHLEAARHLERIT